MYIRAFSAQRFFNTATGSPVDSAHTHNTLDVDIPHEGFHIIPIDADGSSHFMWIEGIVSQTRQRSRFILEIERGDIPRPTTSSTHLPSITDAHYISLTTLQSKARTVASLLGLTDHLADATLQSRVTQCHTCNKHLPVFHAASEICDEFERAWNGQHIQIEFTGPCNEISEWSEEQGFTANTNSDGTATSRLDSFLCERKSCERMQSLIATTRRISQAWIVVRSNNELDEYAWNGRCSSCNVQMPHLQRSGVREFIEGRTAAPSRAEGARVIGGYALSDILSFSLEQVLAHDSLQGFLSAQQRDAVKTLSLTTVTLQQRTTTLSPKTIALIVLLAHMTSDLREGNLIVLDAPLSLFTLNERENIISVAQQLAQRAPVVWLTETTRTARTTPLKAAPSHSSPILGTLTTHGEPSSTYEVSCGSWTSIEPSSAFQHDRLGQLVFQAIQGASTPRVAFHTNHSFSGHFIPLFFPADSSTTRLVAHELGVIEPLAKMFAASHDAKMLGLSPRDFLIGQLRQTATICGTCRGTGLIRHDDGDLLPGGVAPCTSCWGSRLRSPAREVTFKGRTMWEILNASIKASEETLRALPKMKVVVELSTLLGLQHISLGMPTALLSTAQRRILSIANALLSATVSRPAIIVVEDPIAGWSAQHVEGLQKAVTHPQFKERAGWIGVGATELLTTTTLR